MKWLRQNECTFTYFDEHESFHTDTKMQSIAAFKKSFSNSIFTNYFVDSNSGDLSIWGVIPASMQIDTMTENFSRRQ